MLHQEKRTYQCDQCSESFREEALLAEHNRTHEGGRSFEDGGCSKSFVLQGMNGHRKVHTSEKTFECTQCGKWFKHASSLRLHQRLHSGEKLCQCDLCDMAFTQSGGLE